MNCTCACHEVYGPGPHPGNKCHCHEIRDAAEARLASMERRIAALEKVLEQPIRQHPLTELELEFLRLHDGIS